MRIITFLLLFLPLIVSYSATWTVTNTLDDNIEGSFRYCIIQSNVNVGTDTILFSIPNSTINVNSILPSITDDSTYIIGNKDGNNTPKITVNGSSIIGSNAITIISNNIYISNLNIQNFDVSAIFNMGKNNTFNNLTLLNNDIGISLRNDSNLVENCTIKNNNYGITTNMSIRNIFSNNKIYNNNTQGILNVNSQENVRRPTIQHLSADSTLSLYAPPLSKVYIFDDSNDQGKNLIGSYDVDANGLFQGKIDFNGVTNNYITALVDSNDNTSEFSDKFQIVFKDNDTLFSYDTSVVVTEDTTHHLEYVSSTQLPTSKKDTVFNNRNTNTINDVVSSTIEEPTRYLFIDSVLSINIIDSNYIVYDSLITRYDTVYNDIDSITVTTDSIFINTQKIIAFGTTFNILKDTNTYVSKIQNVNTVNTQKIDTTVTTSSYTKTSMDTIVLRLDTIINNKNFDDLIIYTGLSNNGDGIHDYLEIVNIEQFDHKVTIYDRYANVVYQTSNYDNSNPSKRWNGTSNGRRVADAAYYYVIKYGSRTKDGTLYINN